MMVMKYFLRLFSSRINRKNFWGGLVFILLLFPIILMVVNPLLEVAGVYSSVFEWVPLSIFILMALSISIRRLHDTDKSGFYLLLLLVPIVNFLVPVWLVFSKGSVGNNRYGNRDNGFSVKSIFTGQTRG